MVKQTKDTGKDTTKETVDKPLPDDLGGLQEVNFEDYTKAQLFSRLLSQVEFTERLALDYARAEHDNDTAFVHERERLEKEARAFCGYAVRYNEQVSSLHKSLFDTVLPPLQELGAWLEFAKAPGRLFCEIEEALEAIARASEVSPLGYVTGYDVYNEPEQKQGDDEEIPF